MKKMLPLILLLLAPVLLVADSTSAPNSSSTRNKDRGNDGEMPALRAALQVKLTALHAAGSFPGATLGFVLPDGRSGSVSVGLADVDNKIALRPTDRMLAGSIGKTYVAAVMLQLVQEGKVNLDAKIERWFGSDAWFPRLPNAKDITLRMLMNHSSGIPEHVLNKDFIAAMRKDPDRVWKPDELIAYIMDAKPLFAAGQGWSYADTNYEWGVSYGHGGWFPGYRSEMEYFPQRSIAVAVQFNTDAGRALKQGTRAYIADAMRIIIGELEKKRAA
ncbi:MAG: serine hydrolase domain-containing protein [Acidobacteriota bacterium]